MAKVFETIPWVEKYRPSKFDDIVLDKYNKILLENIVKQNNFPNLLFYGPPGTGKTTTIINLINKYQETYNQKHKGLKIHLNASDDRGIEIIRSQINQFVCTKNLFVNGTKFVILDEVDYMTKNAQQALRYLIQQYDNNVKFCLICNYISKIDYALQNEFIRLRFCQLPSKDITRFLTNIVENEKLSLSKLQIYSIQNQFKSDIRSMINFIQSQANISLDNNILSETFFSLFFDKIKNCENKKKLITTVCHERNIRINSFIVEFISYIISNKSHMITNDFLSKMKFIVHNNNVKYDYLISFFSGELEKLL